MDVLMQLFYEKELNKIINDCNELKYAKKEEISKIINYFHEIEFDDNMLRYLILMNPSFLTISSDKIIELIKALKEYGVEDLDMCFYLYPKILNKSVYEIDNFYIKKNQEGYNNDDINTILEVEPYLIDK